MVGAVFMPTARPTTLAWHSHPIARGFRITGRRHAAPLPERLLTAETDRSGLNSELVPVRVTETTAHSNSTGFP
jgi:hypothetical protein